MDAFTLSEPWRRYVSSAQKSRGRFQQTIRAAQPGPLRDRLEEIGRNLEVGLADCWAIAREGDQIDSTIARLRPTETATTLQRLRTEQQESPSDTRAATIESLTQQLASVERLRAGRPRRATDCASPRHSSTNWWRAPPRWRQASATPTASRRASPMS